MEISLILAALSFLIMTPSVMSRNVVEMEANNDDYQDKVIQEVLSELMKSSSKHDKVEVNGFSWSDCGTSSDWVNVTKLSLAPDPLQLPGTLTVAGVFDVKHDLTAELSVSLVVKKKILDVYIEVPCIDNVGSCDYDNVCQMLEKVECPPQLINIGITCKCPISKKLYSLEPASFNVGGISGLSGEYEIQAVLKKGNIQAACIKVYLAIA